MFATACRSLVVHSDQHKSPSEDEANSDEQDETVIRSVPSVLLQGATKRRSQTMIAAVSIRRTPLRLPRRVLCVGQPSAQHRDEPTVPQVTAYMFKSRGVPEMLKKIKVKLTNELRKLAGEEEHSPEPSATNTEPDCVHPAGQGAVRSRSAQAELARRTRAKKNIPQRFPSSHRASPQLSSPARELESLTTNLINRFADVRSVSSQSHREVVIGDRPAEQRPKREDRGRRRRQPECVRQPNCDVA